MTVKINDTICPVQLDPKTELYYVEYEGRATSGETPDELLKNLSDRYAAVVIFFLSFT